MGVLAGLIASYASTYWWPSSTHTQALLGAYEQGKQDALKTNPVSMDLEMVCLGLWAGKQPTLEGQK